MDKIPLNAEEIATVAVGSLNAKDQEIAALRAALERAEKAEARADALAAENARLRGAVEELLAYGVEPHVQAGLEAALGLASGEE